MAVPSVAPRRQHGRSALCARRFPGPTLTLVACAGSRRAGRGGSARLATYCRPLVVPQRRLSDQRSLCRERRAEWPGTPCLPVRTSLDDGARSLRGRSRVDEDDGRTMRVVESGSDVGAAKVRSMHATLAPGHYAVIFNLANHGGLGMHGSGDPHPIPLAGGARGRVAGPAVAQTAQPRRPPSRASAADPAVERGGDLTEVNAADVATAQRRLSFGNGLVRGDGNDDRVPQEERRPGPAGGTTTGSLEERRPRVPQEEPPMGHGGGRAPA
jgi:hypothetical protein